MPRSVSLIFAIAFALAGARIAVAQEFHFEAEPLIKDCGDPSYDKAVKDGITLGIAPVPLYSGIDPQTKQAYGLDVEINQGALGWLGIKQINYEIMPFSQLIAALLAKRVDVIATNIHYTPDRIKVISFTGPAWWYGPGIIVRKGNPTGLKSFDDLKGKEIGAMAGTSADEYLQHMGATVVPFRTNPEHFVAVAQGRIAAVMDDDVKFLAYMKANPDQPLEMVPNVTVPDELIFKYGYGYARYALRKEDCSLRLAYTSALAEIRGNGMVSAILKKYGLSNRNLFFFPAN
ncbi:MAG TPA: transporter substrate-binding domain-containing protein [Stellaceae bacterium]|nr:transporter substrate-binding domain-containing protein [Stellaceae bacterium]